MRQVRCIGVVRRRLPLVPATLRQAVGDGMHVIRWRDVRVCACVRGGFAAMARSGGCPRLASALVTVLTSGRAADGRLWR